MEFARLWHCNLLSQASAIRVPLLLFFASFSLDEPLDELLESESDSESELELLEVLSSELELELDAEESSSEELSALGDTFRFFFLSSSLNFSFLMRRGGSLRLLEALSLDVSLCLSAFPRLSSLAYLL